MQQNSWLNAVYAGNSVKQYLICFFILIVFFIFKKFGSRLFAIIIFKTLKRFSGLKYQDKFVEKTEKSLQLFNFSVAIFAISFVLVFPSNPYTWLDFHFVPSKFAHAMAYVLLTISLVKLLIKVADFIAHVLTDRALENNARLEIQMIPFIKDTITVLLFIFGFLFIIGVIFNLNITTLIGGLGIGGLAVALAAQETIANLIGSFTIFLDKPFTVGDTIESEGIAGNVEKVGFRSTRIRTFDKSFVTVPNKTLVSNKLNNISLSTHRRARFFIHFDNQTTKAQLESFIKSLKHYFENETHTIKDPLVCFYEYHQGNISILITYLVNTIDYNAYCLTREQVNFKILTMVEENHLKLAQINK